MTISFLDNIKTKPFIIFQEHFKLAVEAGEINPQAASISSYNSKKNEISSRFVNIKFLENDKFIFFTNYESPKSKDFENFNQVSVNFYWGTINTQVRIKAYIHKTPESYNQKYFSKRSKKKNALAISSNQSRSIDSFESILKKYNDVLITEDLSACPKYWGGFSISPYEFEFWIGNIHRLNKRSLFLINDNIWQNFILEP